MALITPFIQLLKCAFGWISMIAFQLNWKSLFYVFVSQGLVLHTQQIPVHHDDNHTNDNIVRLCVGTQIQAKHQGARSPVFVLNNTALPPSAC